MTYCKLGRRARVALGPVIAAILILGVVVLGCAETPLGGSSEKSYVDDAGRTVNIQGVPSKIVSLAPGNTEILFALGLGDRVVGVTEFCDYPPEATEKTTVGGFSAVDAERVVSLAPDLIVASSMHVSHVVPEMERLGLTVVVFEAETIDEVLDRITLIGQMAGASDRANELRSSMESRIEAVVARTSAVEKPVRALWVLDENLYVVGPGSFTGDLLTKAGAANVAASAGSPWPQLSMEAIVQADPEVIVVAGHYGIELLEAIKQQSEWQEVSAVKTGRFVVVSDENTVVRPGPRIADGLEALARAIYPEQFE